MSQVVVITGASSGIGRAPALEAVFKEFDVTSEQDVVALVELALERFGRLDVAVNSAAVEAKASFADFDLETYERVFDTNVKGVFISMWAEIAGMRHSGGGGSIVNVGDTSGNRGTPNMSMYAASKHAVEGLTRSAALELAKDGIRVNVVAPGPTLTPMLDRVTGGNVDLPASRVPMGRAPRYHSVGTLKGEKK